MFKYLFSGLVITMSILKLYPFDNPERKTLMSRLIGERTMISPSHQYIRNGTSKDLLGATLIK